MTEADLISFQKGWASYLQGMGERKERRVRTGWIALKEQI